MIIKRKDTCKGLKLFYSEYKVICDILINYCEINKENIGVFSNILVWSAIRTKLHLVDLILGISLFSNQAPKVLKLRKWIRCNLNDIVKTDVVPDAGRRVEIRTRNKDNHKFCLN